MTPAIAYLAPTFPCRTETFVYREVHGLRERGWNVVASALYSSKFGNCAEFDNPPEHTLIVYEWRQLIAFAVELLSHPIRALRTMAGALGDALWPGEPTSVGTRLKLLLQAAAGVALANRYRRSSVRHVRCHFAHSPTTVGMYAAIHLGITFSFTGHANDLFQRRATLKLKLRRARFVACISRWHQALYQAIWPDGSPNYVVVRCGIDTTQWQPTVNYMHADGTLRVLTVCRLVSKKGVDVLIRATARVRRPVVVSIVGDGPELSKLQQLALNLGCNDRIRWLGAVDNSAVRELLKAADLMVIPCRTDSAGDRDGIPVALIEAMACGVPVISGDLPTIRELIEHERSGFIVPQEDDLALAERLDAFTEECRRDFAYRCRSKVEAEFRLPDSIEILQRCLERALDIGTPIHAAAPRRPDESCAQHEDTEAPRSAINVITDSSDDTNWIDERATNG